MLATALSGEELDLTVEGRGEREPVADNATNAGKQANRRVAITFTEVQRVSRRRRCTAAVGCSGPPLPSRPVRVHRVRPGEAAPSTARPAPPRAARLHRPVEEGVPVTELSAQLLASVARPGDEVDVLGSQTVLIEDSAFTEPFPVTIDVLAVQRLDDATLLTLQMSSPAPQGQGLGPDVLTGTSNSEEGGGGRRGGRGRGLEARGGGTAGRGDAVRVTSAAARVPATGDGTGTEPATGPATRPGRWCTAAAGGPGC